MKNLIGLLLFIFSVSSNANTVVAMCDKVVKSNVDGVAKYSLLGIKIAVLQNDKGQYAFEEQFNKGDSYVKYNPDPGSDAILGQDCSENITKCEINDDILKATTQYSGGGQGGSDPIATAKYNFSTKQLQFQWDVHGFLNVRSPYVSAIIQCH